MPKPRKALSGVLPLVCAEQGQVWDGMGGGGERPQPSLGTSCNDSQQWHPLEVWVTPSGNISLRGWVGVGRWGKVSAVS